MVSAALELYVTRSMAFFWASHGAAAKLGYCCCFRELPNQGETRSSGYILLLYKVSQYLQDHRATSYGADKNEPWSNSSQIQRMT